MRNALWYERLRSCDRSFRAQINAFVPRFWSAIESLNLNLESGVYLMEVSSRRNRYFHLFVTLETTDNLLMDPE